MARQNAVREEQKAPKAGWDAVRARLTRILSLDLMRIWRPAEREVAAIPTPSANEYVPRTEFGKRMMERRERIVDTGEPLLSAEEVEAEIARRRGEAAE